MSLAPLKFCLAPDKFKGSLTAAEVARAMGAGILEAIPDAQLTCHILADGGEGTQEAFLAAVPSQSVECSSVDPLQRPISAHYVKLLSEPTAVVEIAEATGLARLLPNERDPLRTTTLGAGQILLQAAAEGAETILVGLGGSSTNDGGCGLAHAFGWRFVDRSGEEVFPIPADFLKIKKIIPPSTACSSRFIVLADVNNPLLGERGCSRMYAAQKGASPSEIEQLEEALKHLADVVAWCLDKDYRDHPGAGAAGGLGYGLLTFLGATLQPGFETIATYTKMEEAVSQCDWVITGEGRLDRQSLEGKGPVALARMARKLGKPVVAIAGAVDLEGDFSGVFDAVFSITNRPMTLAEAQAECAKLVQFGARNMAALIRRGRIISNR